MKNILNIIILALMMQTSYINAQVPCEVTFDSLTKSLILSDPTLVDVEPSTPFVIPNPNIALPPPNEEKAVFWVHGMIGQDVTDEYPEIGFKSWKNAAVFLSNKYLINSQLISYGSDQQTWDIAWDAVKNKIANRWNNPYIDEDGNLHEAVKDQVELDDKSFGIAHSYGSVILRKAATPQQLDGINGIVTFTGVHGGSELAKYIYPAYHDGENNNGSISQDYKNYLKGISSFANDIATGPIAEKIETSLLLGLAESLGFFNQEDLVFSLANTLAKKAGPSIVKELAPTSVQVLSPENMANLDIDEQITSDPLLGSKRIAIAANLITNPDEHDSMFKMFYSGLHSVTNEEWTEAGYHLIHGKNLLVKNKRVYDDKYVLFKNLTEAADLTIGCLFGIANDLVFDITDGDICGTCMYTWQECANQLFEGEKTGMDWDELVPIRDKYYAGKTSFTKLNDFWETLVGARNTLPSTLGTCNYSCLGESYTAESTQEWCSNIANGSWCSSSWESYNIPALQPYDGLIPVTAQLAWDTDPGIFKKTYSGSNHLTIRNDKNTEAALNSMMEGKMGGFFKTAKR